MDTSEIQESMRGQETEIKDPKGRRYFKLEKVTESANY